MFCQIVKIKTSIKIIVTQSRLSQHNLIKALAKATTIKWDQALTRYTDTLTNLG